MTRGGAREGAGRPAPEGVKKSRNIRFTDEEWKLLEQKAKEQEKTISRYIREKALQ